MSIADQLMALDMAGVPANDPSREALLQQMATQGRATAYQLGGIAPGAAAMLTIGAKDERGRDLPDQAPGFVYDTYARLGNLLPGLASGLANFGNAANIDAGTEQPVELKPLPGTQTAQEHVDAAKRSALAEVAHPTPETEEDARNIARGMNIGEAIAPVVPLAAYSKLPSVVSNTARMFIPATQDVLPIVALTKAAQQLPEPSVPEPRGSGIVQPLPDQPLRPIGEEGTTAPPPTAPQQPSLQPIQPLPQEPQSGWTEAQMAGAILAGGALAWAALKFGPRAISDSYDIVRGLYNGLPRDAAAVSKLYEDEALGRNLNMGPGAKLPDMPLPNNASGITRRFTANVQNSNAVIDEMDRAIAATKADGERAVAQNHQINQQGSLTTRMESQMRTGVSPSGRSGPSVITGRQMIDQMTADELETANRAAWARRELNNRADPARGGNPVTYNGAPLTMPGVDSNTLRIWRMQGEANPKIKAWLDNWDSIVDFANKDFEASQLITPGQAQRGRVLYPEWMPTVRQDGSIVHSWDPVRPDLEYAWNTPPVAAWDAQERWYDEAYRQMQLNSWRRQRLYQYENFINANPEYRGLLTWQPGPSEVHTNRMTIYTASGPKYVDVNNGPLYRALDNGPTQMGQVAGWVGGLRRALTSSVVGPLAMVGGNIFALKHAARFMIAGQSQLPRGIYKGYLDRALRRSTGVGLPWDPSTLAGVPYTIATDMGAAFAKNLGDILANNSHPLTNGLRAFIDQSGVDAWRDWLHNRYNASNLAQRAAQGVSGGGSYGIRDVTPRMIGQGGGRTVDPLHNVSPMQGHNSMMASPASPLGQLGQSAKRAALTTSVNMRSLIRDMHGVILDAINGFTYDLNRDNPAIMNRAGVPDTRYLGHIAQSMIGDPATMGSGKVSRYFINQLPLLNIATQATAAVSRSFKNHPIGYALGLMIPSFLLALSSQFSAINSGPEHVNHLDEHMSNAQKEANVIWYHGKGTDPNQNSQFSLPQPFRWFYPYANALIASALGVFKNDGFSQQALEHLLGEFFTKHLSTNTTKQMGQGAVENIPLAVSPLVSGLLALGGAKDPGRIGSALTENYQEDRPLNQGLLTPPTPTRIPGQEERGIWNGVINDDTLRGTLASIFASTGTSLFDITKHAFQRYDQTHDPMWVWKGVQSDWLQNAAEQNKELNIIWKANMPMSVHGPLDEQTNRAVANLRQTLHAEDDIRNAGMTRAHGVPLQLTGKSPVPDESQPEMRWLYVTMGQFARQVEKRNMPAISDMYKELQNIKDSPMMADEKRRIANEINMKISDAKHKLLSSIEVFNEFASQRMGGNVDISKKIDWNAGPGQFK